MADPYWSLRNKLEDVECALTQGQNTVVRMACHELAIRLSHMIIDQRLQTDGVVLTKTLKQDNQPLQETLKLFEEGANQLFLLINDKKDLRAYGVVQRLFELLNALDRNPAHESLTHLHRLNYP